MTALRRSSTPPAFSPSGFRIAPTYPTQFEFVCQETVFGGGTRPSNSRIFLMVESSATPREWPSQQLLSTGIGTYHLSRPQRSSLIDHSAFQHGPRLCVHSSRTGPQRSSGTPLPPDCVVSRRKPLA